MAARMLKERLPKGIFIPIGFGIQQRIYKCPAVTGVKVDGSVTGFQLNLDQDRLKWMTVPATSQSDLV